MPGRPGGVSPSHSPSPLRTHPVWWLREAHGRPGAASSRFSPVRNQQGEATPRPGGAAAPSTSGAPAWRCSYPQHFRGSQSGSASRLLRWPSWFSANRKRIGDLTEPHRRPPLSTGGFLEEAGRYLRTTETDPTSEDESFLRASAPDAVVVPHSRPA